MAESPLQKACIALIRSLKRPAADHAVYGQSRINRNTGDVEQVIIVCRHPVTGLDISVPRKFDGFPVEVHEWPVAEAG